MTGDRHAHGDEAALVREVAAGSQVALAALYDRHVDAVFAAAIRLTSDRQVAVEPSDSGRDLRTFTCPHCKRVQRHIIESAVTEAWLEPKRAINTRKGNAVTYKVDKGRLIPKSTK